MQDHVARIRQLLSEATPKKRVTPSPADADSAMRRAFEYYEFNVGLPVVEQTPRARSLREIARISTWYSWGGEVTRALDAEGVSAAGELSDAGVDILLDRMRALENCAQSGCDPGDMPPAR